MNIFEQYGIKEVADVTLYSIELDENDDERYIPVLYLDTLKVSTVEETAEQASARGGLGNPELIIWDYGKEITVTLEDALYSPASMSMNWGGELRGDSVLELRGYLSNIHNCQNVAYYKYLRQMGTFKFFKMFDFNKAHSYIRYNEDTGKFEEIQLDINNVKFSWRADGIFVPDNKNLLPIAIQNIVVAYGKDTFQESLYPNDKWFVYTYNASKKSVVIEQMTFHIDDSCDTDPQFIPYKLRHNLNDVEMIDRMEKCIAKQNFVIDVDNNNKHNAYRYDSRYDQSELIVYLNPKTMLPYESNTDYFKRRNGEIVEGNLCFIKQYEIYYKWTRTIAEKNASLGHQITIDPIHFPGTYRLVGETYSRDRKNGKDRRFQFEIPLCKMGSENNLTLEAEGEPTTFNMSLKVLRREDGVMMKLTEYDITHNIYDKVESSSTKILPTERIEPDKKKE